MNMKKRILTLCFQRCCCRRLLIWAALKVIVGSADFPESQPLAPFMPLKRKTSRWMNIGSAKYILALLDGSITDIQRGLIWMRKMRTTVMVGRRQSWPAKLPEKVKNAADLGSGYRRSGRDDETCR